MTVLHASPGIAIDVRLLKEPFSNAKTQMLVKTDALESVQLVWTAGKTISEHQGPSKMTFRATADEIENAESVLSSHGVDVQVHGGPETVGV